MKAHIEASASLLAIFIIYAVMAWLLFGDTHDLALMLATYAVYMVFLNESRKKEEKACQ